MNNIEIKMAVCDRFKAYAIHNANYYNYVYAAVREAIASGSPIGLLACRNVLHQAGLSTKDPRGLDFAVELKEALLPLFIKNEFVKND
jgi:hypothetical protein